MTRGPVGPKLARMLRAVRWAAILVAAALAVACGPSAPPKITGTYLDAQPAPALTLTDGLTGRPTSLAELRGRPVVLTFLYTRCPDACPLTAQRLRQAQRTLGTEAANVEMVAVSVDPVNDTPQAVRDFSRSYELTTNWRYLVGTEAALRAVWGAYGVRAVADPSLPTVSHADAIYVIDRRGRERALLHTSDPAEDLVSLLRFLIAER